ncbi:GNAT family N-acetyltransferase [Liquorilactobacillus capillatus]|uniref:Acetyltransferase, GNAT family n=1 Tax=Liquorilactobacillus capillatus DSM 19910 TaxID=1423731 RepID=A0A0R1M5A7_9LACO|nr:GNAT family N-acetyltransferase [Liquorilactobacillus capillatus]KRL02993.1 acetyltransferase, GNAT family [Liquorilactobacillus capillatus DSM 19910]
MLIQPAQKDDVPQIIPLFKIILHEMELPALKTIPQGQFDYIIQLAFESKAFRNSIGTTIVAKNKDQVAGFAFGYPAAAEEKINNVWTSAILKAGLPQETELFTDDETLPHEWYLDSLAVAPTFQGQGIGTKLLNALPKLALASGNSEIGLSVDLQNPLAEKLYTRLGYKKVATTTISNHQYHHMRLKV